MHILGQSGLEMTIKAFHRTIHKLGQSGLKMTVIQDSSNQAQVLVEHVFNSWQHLVVVIALNC